MSVEKEGKKEHQSRAIFFIGYFCEPLKLNDRNSKHSCKNVCIKYSVVHRT